MKKKIFTLFLLFTGVISVSAQSGIYACGHFRRNRPVTVEKLRNSGFTDICYFNISVGPDGSLASDYNFEKNEGHDGGGLVVKDGVYVFDKTCPHFVEDIRALKQQPTGVRRISICIGGWGNTSYNNIKNLVKKYGTGPASILYINFKTLLDTLKVIDAVNNDDEGTYDVETEAQFHEMLFDLGLHTTIAPYTNQNFWRNLVNEINNARPGAVDRNWVQCYSGGAGNNPANWDINGITRYGGRNSEDGSSVAGSINQMQKWMDAGSAKGGFFWNYNNEDWDHRYDMNLNECAAAMNRIFKAKTTDAPAATFYSTIGYGGYGVSLPVGDFSMPEMSLYGIAANDISSFKVNDGYRITLYSGTVVGEGDSISYASGDRSWIGTKWNDRVCAIRIESTTPTGINSVTAPADKRVGATYNILGQKVDDDTKGLVIKNGKKYINK